MLQKCLLPLPAAIIDVIRTIERSSSGVALAVNHENVLVGVISDGDVRRGLLRGLTLQDSAEKIMTRDFFAVKQGTGRDQVLELMQARSFSQVPVVDDEFHVMGLHLLHALLRSKEHNNPVIIMAGGKGTRLGELTQHTPKPMLKVAGRPILERIILRLQSHGFHQIYLAVNHLSHMIEEYFGDGTTCGCQIRYLRESKPLGSGGAISLLPPSNIPILVVNGDLITDADYSSMLEYHQRNDFYATMGVHSYSHEIPFGCIESRNGRIEDIAEKPLITREVNAGIYVISPAAAANVPRETFFPVTDLFEEALHHGRPCGAYRIEGDWSDIGHQDQLKRARGETY